MGLFLWTVTKGTACLTSGSRSRAKPEQPTSQKAGADPGSGGPVRCVHTRAVAVRGKQGVLGSGLLWGFTVIKPAVLPQERAWGCPVWTVHKG